MKSLHPGLPVHYLTCSPHNLESGHYCHRFTDWGNQSSENFGRELSITLAGKGQRRDLNPDQCKSRVCLWGPLQYGEVRLYLVSNVFPGREGRREPLTLEEP